MLKSHYNIWPNGDGWPVAATEPKNNKNTHINEIVCIFVYLVHYTYKVYLWLLTRPQPSHGSVHTAPEEIQRAREYLNDVLSNRSCERAGSVFKADRENFIGTSAGIGMATPFSSTWTEAMLARPVAWRNRTAKKVLYLIFFRALGNYGVLSGGLCGSRWVANYLLLHFFLSI